MALLCPNPEPEAQGWGREGQVCREGAGRRTRWGDTGCAHALGLGHVSKHCEDLRNSTGLFPVSHVALIFGGCLISLLVVGPHFLLRGRGGNFRRGTEASSRRAQCGRRGGCVRAGHEARSVVAPAWRGSGETAERLLRRGSRASYGKLFWKSVHVQWWDAAREPGFPRGGSHSTRLSTAPKRLHSVRS